MTSSVKRIRLPVTLLAGMAEKMVFWESAAPLHGAGYASGGQVPPALQSVLSSCSVLPFCVCVFCSVLPFLFCVLFCRQ